MNILVIDDNKDITDAISLFAESQGHSCLVSNDGKEGCNIAKKDNFDLLLLDITMPEFSGYDVLDTLKNDSNFDMKKIVVFTASSLDSSVVKKIESLGVTQLARKPLSLDSLSEIFSKYETGGRNTFAKQVTEAISKIKGNYEKFEINSLDK